MFASLDLSSGWSFRRFGDKAWLPAAVPGNVFLDLYQAGLIPDPYYRDHEKQVQWVGYEDWEYRTFFSLDKELEAPRIDLLFEGLDTLATVTLNDHVILIADNMFRTWRVEVRRFLQPQNELHILFRSPIRSLLPQIESLDVRCPAVNDLGEGTSPYVRKAPYQFGWDWGPRLLGCGVWKPIHLQVWDIARIESLQILTADLALDRAEVSVLVEIEAITEAEIDVVLSSMDGAFLQKRRRIRLSVGRQTVRFDVVINRPKPWEPNGRGEAHLYRLILFIEYRGQVLDERQARFGLRTVRLEEEPNTDGAGFTFVVNNKPLFAKGANWIPADCFPHRVSRDKYRELLLACRDAGMNMLRVWGGGIYESDDFYDLCDELGLLVWQDFMFSCALYPAEGEFLDSVKQEAVDQIKRLRNHPCLALWCGNNEIEWGWQAFGWSARFPIAMFQKNQLLFREILPQIVAALDPSRPYWPSSPSSDGRADANSQSFGDMHYWDVWHKAAPFAAYLDQHPRFMSEFGFQSFPAMETVKTFAEPQDFDIESPVMMLHQKNPRGNPLIRDYLLRYYPPAKDFASFLYLSQVQQAEAIRTAAEHLRRIQPHCMGALYWQLNDCWPVASWSSIDYEGNWKALHYAAVRFYKPLLVSPLLTEEEIRVYVVSDLEESIAATLLIELLTFDGQIIRRERRPVFIQPNSSGLFAVMPRSELGVAVPERSLLYCALEGQDVENVLYFVEPKERRLEHSHLFLSVEKVADGFELTMSAERLLSGVYLGVDDVKGRFSDNFFDLLPNRPRKVVFHGAPHLSLREFQDRLQVISLIDVVIPPDDQEAEPYRRLKEFELQGLSLRLTRGDEVICESRDAMLKPLFSCLVSRRQEVRGAVMIDKIVGKAAAMLAALGGVSHVVTPTASASAKEYLQQVGIPLTARRIIPHIINREGTDLCPMEKLADSCGSPEELFQKLQKMIRL